MSRGAVAVTFLVVTAAGIAVAQDEGAVVGRPELAVSAPNSTVGSGERVTLDVFLSNAGVLTQGGPPQFEERVQTARNVQFEVAEDRLSGRLARALDVKTGTITAGTVPPGTAGPFPVTLEVNESLEPGTYRVPVRITYSYTRFVDFGPNEAPQYVEADETVIRELTLVVESRAEFSLSAADARVPAGDTRSYTLALENRGSEVAREVELLLRAANSSVFFGGLDERRPVTSVVVPRLEPGERRLVNVTVGVMEAAAPGSYLLNARVQYRNPAGVLSTSDPLTVGVRVAPRQSFAVRNVSGDLRVAERGRINGSVVNTGPTTVHDAVVVVSSTSPNLQPVETEYAVGTLEPGERAAFGFRVAAANATDGGPRSVSFRVRYTNREGDQRSSKPMAARVAVAPEQSFAVANVTDSVVADGSGTLSGTIVNTGNESVSDVVVSVSSANPNVRPREGEFAVGPLGPGERAPFSFTVDTANSTDPGPKPVTYRVRYTDSQGDRRRSDAIEGRVTVGREQSFEIRGVRGDLRVGERGTVRGTVVNTGNESVSDARLVLAGENPNLRPREREYALGALAPDESRAFAFSFAVVNDTDPGPRTLSFRVRYRDRQDDVRSSESLDAQVAVAREQTFAVRNVSGDLQVGRSGTVTGTVVNTGDDAVRNAVVALDTGNPSLVAGDAEYAVGDLAPGEAANFSFEVDATAEGEPGPRQVSFSVRYRDGEGDVQRSETLDARVRVEPQADEFRVEAVNATVPRGESAVVEVRVTNVDDRVLTDVSAKLFANDPLSSDDDEAYVQRLAPNESAVLRFSVSAGDGALMKDYPVSIDFSYEEPDGDTALSDTYRLPVRVVEAENGGFLPFDLPPAVAVTAGVGVLAVAAAAAFRLRRGRLR